MKKISSLLLFLAAVITFAACGGTSDNKPANATNANAANANAANTAAKTAPAAPTKDALMAIEKQGWESWKNRDPKAYEEILSDKYVAFGLKGRVDKAGAVKSFTEQKCEVKSYSFTDDQMTLIGSDVAVLTFKAAQDYVCDGKKGAPETWSASVYVRDGDKWKNAFYAETPVVDPKAAAAPGKTGEAKAAESKPDALTDAMMVVEKEGWDGWVARDPKRVEGVMAKDFMYFSGTGRKDKAESMKGWSEPKCTGLGYTFVEPMGVQLSKDVALVTYKSNVKGSCDGKPLGSTIWVASFDIKEGDAWKNAFYMDLPR